MKIKKHKKKKLFALIVVGVVCVFVSLSFIYTYKLDSLDKPEKQTELPHDLSPESDEVSSPQRMGNSKQFSKIVAPQANKVKTQNAQPINQTSPAVDNAGDKIVEGVGLTVDQLKALHAKQIRDIDSINSKMAAPFDEAIAQVTVEELEVIHAQQRNLFELTPSANEVVIPVLENEPPGLTAMELAALHK